MRASDSLTRPALPQAMEFAGELIRSTLQRRGRHAGFVCGRVWRSYRPAHLPLYALAGIIGVAVLLLVMTAWLRVILPFRGVRSISTLPAKGFRVR